MSLRELAADALAKLKKAAPSSVELELYLSKSEERSIDLRDGSLDGIQNAVSEGSGLRVTDGGRLAFSSVGRTDLESILGLLPRALEQLPYAQPDDKRALPAPAKDGEDQELAKSLWDDKLFTTGWDVLRPRLEKLTADVKKTDKRVASVLRAGYSESRGEVAIASSRGVLTHERGGSCSVGASALCDDGGDKQVGSAYQSSRAAAALDFDKVARQAAERTTALLGASKLPGGRRSVIFDPWVSGEFLELISGLLCADEAQRGKSLLAGKLGQKVGSELLTFVDDPRKKGGMASALYDDEGASTRRKLMIERGVVKDFFHDAYTAARENRQTNASAGRGSYRGLPSPGPSNFYLEAGKTTLSELMRSTKDGVVVLDIMGMHMADPISGEFSVGVSGLSVKDGVVGRAVKGAMISGNLLELLNQVDCVADDLTFYGAMGAPTFRVGDLTVA